ncbi:MAG: 50S ribosomal protein L15 [Clostridiaceae bacterium]|jgi:large subunit ribosomal protein L15|nr:50S ribosomal protein L15 [Clostridiaceae bacterium]
MKINELSATPGARQTAYRKGRGPGSGNGKTAGRGHKGQNSRSGGGVRPGFEGGQMPLYRRLPKRGFNNKRFAVQYIEINVGDLDRFDEGMTLDALSMKQSGLITLPKVNDGIKILGNGELTKKLHVRANAFTASAKDKIEKAGGTAEEV